MTEDEMVGWHHQLNGHEPEQTLGDGERGHAEDRGHTRSMACLTFSDCMYNTLKLPFHLELPYEGNRWLFRAGESLQLWVGCRLRQRQLSSNSTRAPKHTHLACSYLRDSCAIINPVTMLGEEWMEILTSKRGAKCFAFC